MYLNKRKNSIYFRVLKVGCTTRIDRRRWNASNIRPTGNLLD